MSPRTIILILAAVSTVGGTVYFARNWLNSERAALEAMRKKPEVKKVAKIYVLVAKVNLAPGTFLKPNHVTWQVWPSASLHSTYFRRKSFEIESLVGSVVRRGISAGEPMTKGRIAKPGDRGFMAAVLNPGMRAATLRINAVTGVAGFAFPGDRVDILLTHRITIAGRRGRVATETLLTSVRILAIDQNVVENQTKARVAKTVTLEVTPKQAEFLTVAANLGRLSLTLRSLGRTVGGSSRDRILASGVVLDLNALANRAPSRGRSFTLDSQTSRLLSAPSNTVDVLIVRGSKRSAISFPKGP